MGVGQGRQIPIEFGNELVVKPRAVDRYLAVLKSHHRATDPHRHLISCPTVMKCAAPLLVEVESESFGVLPVWEAVCEGLPTTEEGLEEPRAVACMVPHPFSKTLNGFQNEAIKGEDRKAKGLVGPILVDIDQRLSWRDEATMDAIPQNVD